MGELCKRYLSVTKLPRVQCCDSARLCAMPPQRCAVYSSRVTFLSIYLNRRRYWTRLCTCKWVYKIVWLPCCDSTIFETLTRQTVSSSLGVTQPQQSTLKVHAELLKFWSGLVLSILEGTNITQRLGKYCTSNDDSCMQSNLGVLHHYVGGIQPSEVQSWTTYYSQVWFFLLNISPKIYRERDQSQGR